MTAPGEPVRTLYLVDGTNNLFRAFFAIRGLRSSQGVPTNAVFGFTSMLRKLIKDHDPRYLAVAFDRPEPTFRHQAYADYKAHRPEAPADLIAQIPHVKQVCAVLGVPLIELAGFEADDLIGTLAQRAAEAGFKVVIVGTGGMSHQLDGQRAGHINKDFDQLCLEKLVHDPEAIARFSNTQLVELAGTQGVEILMWIAARGTLTGEVSKVHSHYHIPISNTAAGVLVLENQPNARPARAPVAA